MRRRTLMLAAAFALASPMTALAVRPHHERPAPPPPPAGDPRASTMLFHGSMPAVAAIIDGKGPFTLAIDTGDPGSLELSQPIVDALGLKVVGHGVATDPSGKNPVRIARYRAGAISLCGLTFANVEIESLPVMGGAPPFDGVLGMNLFSALVLTLDFKGKQVAAARGALPAVDGQSVLAYPPGELIQLPVDVGGVTIPSHLDTGQQIAPYMAPESYLPRLATSGAPRKIGLARTVSQSYELFSVGIAKPVRVGAVPLPVTEVAYPTVVPIGNIGSKALQAMTVDIDRAAHRVRFQT